MAARKTAAKAVEQPAEKTAEVKTYTVNVPKLKLRATPSKDGEVLSVLPFGLRLTVDAGRKAPAGWTAIDGTGYVMTEFLK